MSDPRYHPKLRSGYTYHICNQGNNRENIFKEGRNYPFFLEKYQRFIGPIVHTFAYCLMPNHFHMMVQFKSYAALHDAFPNSFPKPPKLLHDSTDICTADGLLFDNEVSLLLSNQFRKWFSGYARAINMMYHRTGKLFQLPFNRILVDNENYFSYLIAYIHRNPVHHRFCKEYTDWEYSSYQEILSFLEANSNGGFIETNGVNTKGKTNSVKKLNCVSTKSANTMGILDLPFLLDWFGSVDNYLVEHQSALLQLEEKWLLEN